MTADERWFYLEKGKLMGLFNAQKMRELAKSGVINSEMYVWEAKMPGMWKRLRDTELAIAEKDMICLDDDAPEETVCLEPDKTVFLTADEITGRDPKKPASTGTPDDDLIDIKQISAAQPNKHDDNEDWFLEESPIKARASLRDFSAMVRLRKQAKREKIKSMVEGFLVFLLLLLPYCLVITLVAISHGAKGELWNLIAPVAVLLSCLGVWWIFKPVKRDKNYFDSYIFSLGYWYVLSIGSAICATMGTACLTDYHFIETENVLNCALLVSIWLLLMGFSLFLPVVFLVAEARELTLEKLKAARAALERLSRKIVTFSRLSFCWYAATLIFIVCEWYSYGQGEIGDFFDKTALPFIGYWLSSMFLLPMLAMRGLKLNQYSKKEAVDWFRRNRHYFALLALLGIFPFCSSGIMPLWAFVPPKVIVSVGHIIWFFSMLLPCFIVLLPYIVFDVIFLRRIDTFDKQRIIEAQIAIAGTSVTVENYQRQLGILSPAEMARQTINIVGCGGIGSAIALILTKLGFPKIVLFDHDRIEAHNLPNQYLPETTGVLKTEGFVNLVQQISCSARERIIGVPTIVDNRLASYMEGIVVLAVDSMEARKEIFQGIKFRPSVKLLVDGRMAGETGRIYTIRVDNPLEIQFYEKSLYSDEEAFVEGACTAQAIAYNTTFIGSLMANQIKRAIKNEPYIRLLWFDLRTLEIFKENPSEE